MIRQLTKFIQIKIFGACPEIVVTGLKSWCFIKLCDSSIAGFFFERWVSNGMRKSVHFLSAQKFAAGPVWTDHVGNRSRVCEWCQCYFLSSIESEWKLWASFPTCFFLGAGSKESIQHILFYYYWDLLYCTVNRCIHYKFFNGKWFKSKLLR